MALLGLTCLTFARLLELPPWEPDNLYILGWADQTSLAGVLSGDPGFYPEWRPLAYFVVWLAYKWNGLHTSAYFGTNILIWTLCAWLIYRIVRALTDSSSAALVASATVATDSRALHGIMVIIDVQNLLACLFGLIALSLVLGRTADRITWARWCSLSLLLLASALSKEYGLAFAGAIALGAPSKDRLRLSSVSATAIVAYAAIRFACAGGALSAFCEEMGYWGGTRSMCYDSFRYDVAAQVAYNAAAMGIGSMMPGLFSGDGQIALARLQLLLALPWTLAAGVGMATHSRSSRIPVLVVVSLALLGFVLYRDRNQLVAVCAIGILGGIGVSTIDRWSARQRHWPGIRLIGMATFCALVVAHAWQTRWTVAQVVHQSLGVEPCIELAGTPYVDTALIARAKRARGVSDPDCTGVGTK